MSSTKPILQCRDISAGYGNTPVIHKINVNIYQHDTVCVTGPTGAGKSTFLKAIAGWLSLSHGEILFCNTNISYSAISDRSRLGISFCPDSRAILRNLSIRDNIFLAKNRNKQNTLYIDPERYFPFLINRADVSAGSLSGGQQQILSLCCGLYANPKLLIIDELSEGLNPQSIDSVLRLIDDYRTMSALGIICVEQKPQLIVSISNRIIELNRGSLVSDITTNLYYNT